MQWLPLKQNWEEKVRLVWGSGGGGSCREGAWQEAPAARVNWLPALLSQPGTFRKFSRPLGSQEPGGARAEIAGKILFFSQIMFDVLGQTLSSVIGAGCRHLAPEFT